KSDILADRVEQKCKELVEQIGYQCNYFTISASMKKGTDELAKILNEFLQKQE
ncbi:GTPase ObgE, partial [Francisella tularensis subsp. holarctica]|nr:GTPase ObgE [Francisella tularensis subsp. holarctica]